MVEEVHSMDEIKAELLNILQCDFPIEGRPYLTIAKKLKVSEEDVINLVKTLKEEGYIRRIGGIFDSKKLGYTSTLCAVMVPDNKIDEVSIIINSYPGVTHNYLRKHLYNIWFTLTAQSNEDIKSIIEEIKLRTGIYNIMTLEAKNTFKIKVNFTVKGA
jgi:siroheme decarboxylase